MQGINCLVNWERVCALKVNGGLGIIDLSDQNDALLTKWLWDLETKTEGSMGKYNPKIMGSLHHTS